MHLSTINRMLREMLRDPVRFFSGFARYLYLQAARREVVVTGGCAMCGQCCRCIVLAIRNVPLTSEKHFESVVRDHPEFGRFRITGRTSCGELRFECSWLQEDNSCRDHDNRLKICREYPSPELYFSATHLPSDCGYRLQAARPFASILRDRMKKAPKKVNRASRNGLIAEIRRSR